MNDGEEVIRIRVDGIDDRGLARWSAMYGQGHCGEWRFPIPALEVADELVIAVRPLLATWVPTRIVQSGGKEVVEPRTTDDEEPWTPQVDRRHRPIEPGDLITDVVVFSASDGSGRTSKKRPCLVMEVGDTEIRVRPIHSTGGSLHRTGGGLRILDWRLANLANNSVVSAEDQYRAVDGPVNPARRIGSLSDRDFERVFGHGRTEAANGPDRGQRW